MSLSVVDARQVAAAAAAAFTPVRIREAPPAPAPIRVQQTRKVPGKVTRTVSVERKKRSGVAPLAVLGLAVVSGIYFSMRAEKIGPFVGLFLVGALGAAALTFDWTTATNLSETETVDGFVDETYWVEVPSPPGEVVEKAISNPAFPTAIGILRLKTLALPLGDRVLLVDPEGAFPETDLSLRTLRTAEAVYGTIEEIRKLSELVPAVLHGCPEPRLAGQSTPFGELVPLVGPEKDLYDLQVRLAEEIGAQEPVLFRIPLVAGADWVKRALVSGTAPAEVSESTLEVRKLLDFLSSPAGEPLHVALAESEDVLRGIDSAWRGARRSSLESQLAPFCSNLGQIFHYTAFAFYCPLCNAEAQADLLKREYAVEAGEGSAPIAYSPNTRLFKNLDTGRWSCLQCGRSTTEPIPLHRSLDELILPAYDRLMEENKNARIEVYARARSQQRDFSNQFNRETSEIGRENRSRLESLDDDLNRLNAEIAGEEEAIRSFRQLIAASEQATPKLLQKIADYQQSLKAQAESAEKKVRQDLGRFFDEEIRSTYEKMMQRGAAQRLENDRRDVLQREIAGNMARTASATERGAAAGERAAVAGERGAAAGERTAAAGERTATATEASGKKLDDMVAEQRQGNAIAGAMGKKMGIERHAAWYDVGGHIAQAGADLRSTLGGEDEVVRSRREQEALK